MNKYVPEILLWLFVINLSIAYGQTNIFILMTLAGWLFQYSKTKGH